MAVCGNSTNSTLKKIDKIIARMMFESGPAKEMRAKSFFGFFKLYGSTGTGFAQPNRKGDLNISRVMGRIMVPNISM